MSKETISRVYPIQRWDCVMFDNSTTQVPVIYIKPDDLFIAFAHKNSYAVNAKVSGTNVPQYEVAAIPGVVDKSSRVPNCKPHFFEKTGLYVVSLWSQWYGYPDPNNLGSVTFSGLYDVTEKDIEEVREVLPNIDRAPKPIKVVNGDKNDKNDKGMGIASIAMVAGMLVFILVLLVLFLK